jgi:hypothetical protein
MGENLGEISMHYDLQIWNSTAFVSSKEVTYAELRFHIPQLELYVPDKNDDACVTAPTRRELSAFVKGLSTDANAILKKQKKARASRCRRHVRWKVGQCVLSLPANSHAKRIIQRLNHLSGQISPLLELAEVICQQIKCRHLTADPSVRFDVRNKVDGMDVEQWLAARKAAAEKINPKTAEIAWWYVQLVDPYGIRGEPPGKYSCVGLQYFAASRESDGWVWFGDLPRSTSDALQKRIEKEQSRVNNGK